MSQLPAWLQSAQPSRLSDTLGSNLGGGAPPFLSIMGNRLTLVDTAGDSEPVTTVDPKTGVVYLDCCIIDVGDHASKIYYGKAFDPNAQSWSPPDCWSDNGVAPSINASLPQAKTCTPDPTNTFGCAKAVWGSKTSAVSGKGIPACGKYQKLALLIPGDDVIFLLRVPPNSLDNLRGYNAKFKGQPIGIEGVITRISFEPQGLGTLTFNAINYVDEETWRRRTTALAAKATDLLVGRGDQPHPGVASLPAPARQEAQALPTQPAAALPAPTAGFPSTATAPAQTQTAPVAQAASPSEPAPAGRRRRRTAAEMAAASPQPNGQQAAAPAPAQAPFRMAEPPPAQPGAAFGVTPGVAPNPELQGALNSIFGPK